MALVFEYEKDLDTGAQPQICHEPDSIIYNYFIREERALDTHSEHAFGQYDNVTFVDEERHLTTKAVDRIGIVNFPGIGGIGFYRDAYSDDSRVVAPIHVTAQHLSAPVLQSVTVEEDKLRIVITPPSNVNYNVYRLVARMDNLAVEYITYKTEYRVDLPTVKGAYTCYCIGYDESTGAVSDPSNEVELVITTGNPDWKPYIPSIGNIEQRVSTLENEVKDYPDEEVHEAIAAVLGGANNETN